MCYMLHFLPCNYSKNIGWIAPSDRGRPLFLLSGKMATFTLSELASDPFLPLKII